MEYENIRSLVNAAGKISAEKGGVFFVRLMTDTSVINRTLTDSLCHGTA
jgi:hypothetical protein